MVIEKVTATGVFSGKLTKEASRVALYTPTSVISVDWTVIIPVVPTAICTNA